MGIILSRTWLFRNLQQRGVRPLPSQSDSDDSDNSFDSASTSSSSPLVPELNGAESQTHSNYSIPQNSASSPHKAPIKKLNQDLLLRLVLVLSVKPS